MADGVFNISKGKVAEYVERVANNDPANSVLVVVLGLGAITDATLKDLDDLAAVEADAGFSESVDGSYARKVVDQTDGSLGSTVDDTNDRMDSDLSDQTWTGMTGETLTRLLICYDSDSTGGTDSAIVPCTFHDFSVTTDGSDLTAQFNSQGFFSAS